MMENKPLVSVLMTAYNREQYISEAIDSVLASTYQNFELIIVDDGSRDNTVKIAKFYASKDSRIKVYVNEQNLGDYPNRNKAASYAEGKYIKYLDSDDLIYPHGLAIMVESMEQYPEAAIGITSKNPIPLNPFPILLAPQASFTKHFFEYGLLDFGPSGVILQRDVFLKMGGFTGKRLIGDIECWCNLAMKNSILELQPSLIFWRQHDSQEFRHGLGHIDKGYFIIKYRLLRDILISKDCPLDEFQKKEIIKKTNAIHIKEIFKYFIKTGKIRTCISVYQKLGLNICEFF